MRAMSLIVGMAAGLASAGMASASVVVQIEVIATDADSGNPLGSYQWQSTVSPDGTYGWGPSDPGYAPVTFANNASLNSLTVSWNHDPTVGNNFNVTSGTTNTTFTVNSSIVSFSTINGPFGRASAFVGVTNNSFGPGTNSFTLTGLEPGGTLFASRFNSDANTFVNLINGPGTVALAPGQSQSYTDNNRHNPSDTGYDPLSADAFDMDSQFKFTLSMLDSASGTSTYEIIPAPSSAALVGLAGLLVRRRRR